MDVNKLISWKKNPSLIGKVETEDLEKLVADFPYFSMGHILLAKGYKNTNHYKYDGQLKKASMYCEDRNWLYAFMNKQLEVKPAIVEKKVEEKKKPVEPVVVKKEAEVVVKQEIESMEPMVLDASKSWKITGEATLLDKKSVRKPRVKKLVEKEKESSTVQTEEVEETKKPTKPAKVAKEVDVPGTDKKKPKAKSKKKKKLKKTVVLDDESLLNALYAENIPYNIEDYYSDENLDSKVEETPEPKVEPKTTPAGKDFFAWLEDTNSGDGKDRAKKEPKKIANEKPKEFKENQKPHDSIQVIDGFLKTGKSKKKKKQAKFFSPNEMAKQSDMLEGEIVSETLAKVFEDQERYREALGMYEKLILLFPQKEAYFAARIKSMQEKIKG